MYLSSFQSNAVRILTLPHHHELKSKQESPLVHSHCSFFSFSVLFFKSLCHIPLSFLLLVACSLSAAHTCTYIFIHALFPPRSRSPRLRRSAHPSIHPSDACCLSRARDRACNESSPSPSSIKGRLRPSRSRSALVCSKRAESSGGCRRHSLLLPFVSRKRGQGQRRRQDATGPGMRYVLPRSKQRDIVRLDPFTRRYREGMCRPSLCQTISCLGCVVILAAVTCVLSRS